MKRIAMTIPMLTLVAALSAAVGNMEILEVRNATNEVTYSTDVGLEISHTVQVRHRGPAKSFFVTISTGQSGSFADRTLVNGSDTLTYQLHSDSVQYSVVKDLSVPVTDSEVLAGYAAEFTDTGWQTVDLSYVITIPAGQSLVAGTYSDSLTLTLYEGTLDNYTEANTATLSISGPVASTIDMAIVDTGAAFPGWNPQRTRLLDFGDLTVGESLACDLLVEANCAFKVHFQSENAGVMVNSDPADTSVVPYTLRVDGAVTDLSSGDPVQVGQSPTIRFPVEVTIGDFGTATAGTYEDVITITVAAQ